MAKSGKITDSLDQFADLLPGFLYQLERSPAGVFRYRYVSSGMQRILGVSPAEALADADGVLAMIHPDDIDRVIEESMQTAAELRPWRSEFRMRARDGRLIWIEAQDLPVKEPDGTILWSGYANDVSEKKLLEQKIRDLARFDGLTGLPNRQNFIDLVENNLLRARRNRSRFALFFVDLDRFKPVNDSCGHAAGDELLKAVAARLRGALRESDIVGRFGGDEFLVLLPDIAQPADAVGVAEKIGAALDRTFELPCGQFSISSSIGIAIYPDNGRAVDRLIENADLAMYEVKKDGGGSYRFSVAAG
ncbi:MAG: sensor domain-containing diguanylate cyclase [Burkholderiales bacterium]|nr:sensor domain-containing diguanylate cyclase [Burkholderiales bacterium]